MGGIKTRIDLEQLKKEIANLTPDKELYIVLRDGLKKLGHWKQLKRGKPNPNFKRR